MLGSGSSQALPPPPRRFDITMQEYAFDHLPVAPSGRVVVQVHNAGSLPHQLVLVKLPEDLPPLAEQLRSDTRQAVDTLANLTDRPAGSRNTIAVDLDPGRYGLVCFLRDPDGLQHHAKGMSSEFRVA